MDFDRFQMNPRSLLRVVAGTNSAGLEFWILGACILEAWILGARLSVAWILGAWILKACRLKLRGLVWIGVIAKWEVMVGLIMLQNMCVCTK